MCQNTADVNNTGSQTRDIASDFGDLEDESQQICSICRKFLVVNQWPAEVFDEKPQFENFAKLYISLIRRCYSRI
jgi:hypothetical protein